MTALSKVCASDSDIRGIVATNLMVRGPARGPVLIAPRTPSDQQMGRLDGSEHKQGLKMLLGTLIFLQIVCSNI